MLGMRAIYHEGWLANTLHPPLSGWGNFETDVWELYHLAEDRAQTRNVAAEHPEQLEELKGLWFYNAGIYKGLPARRPDRTGDHSPRRGPSPTRAARPLRLLPGHRRRARVGGRQPPAPLVHDRGRRHVSTRASAEGVLFAQGGVGGGHSLYLQGRHGCTTRTTGSASRDQKITSDVEVTAGKHVLHGGVPEDGRRRGDGERVGTLTLYIDDAEVGSAEIMTQPGIFALTGDGLCVGRDSASPVSPDYRAPYPFAGGTIDRVVVDVSGDHYVDHEKEVLAYLARD